MVVFSRDRHADTKPKWINESNRLENFVMLRRQKNNEMQLYIEFHFCHHHRWHLPFPFSLRAVYRDVDKLHCITAYISLVQTFICIHKYIFSLNFVLPFYVMRFSAFLIILYQRKFVPNPYLMTIKLFVFFLSISLALALSLPLSPSSPKLDI